ncbi:carcinoembryonic antigen-related cell adhesion molecule 5-like [Xenia sp. Carnegie-2017]|uniref:carcinoembryonic antigen-related cell adhesion molecule 5-like n=1 Tax=Xenia sp. Carnegie-2017 TaxID=2897299 RepID=UPI001F0434F0|nr:carcinoembryonic antigen-related cell adhesion molecule 5-like [Xenia sp. Carnegie-2017]
MAKFDFLSFVLFWWISTCQGIIQSPPPDTNFTFLLGETHSITWTFNDSESDLDSRTWYFTGSSNGSPRRRLATVLERGAVIKTSASTPSNYDVCKPSTLQLRNITHSYDGTYEFILERKDDISFTSTVRVFVARNILSPPNGPSFTFLPGETHNITWTFSDRESDLDSRDWYFTGSSNSPPRRRLATVIERGAVIKTSASTPSNYDVYKPSTLQLRIITPSYDGTYKFILERKDDISFTSEVRVFVAMKPNVVIYSSNPLVVNEGDNVSCTLVITNVTLNDGGRIYKCEAQSYDSTDYRDENPLKYKSTKTNQYYHQSNVSKKKGQNVIVTCESDGYPEPTYTIYHNGAVISNKKTYIINSINFSNAGSYRCEAKNKLENDSSDVKNLTIITVKPTVVINCSTPLVVNEGDNVSCVCRGEGGIPPANVTWFDKHNNIIGDVGVVSKTLVITNVTLNDGGNYRCKAQSYNDPRFRDEKSIEVTVKATYNVLCDDQKGRIKQYKTEWYIILITLTSGIIVGILVSIVFQYRQHWFCKNCQQFQSPPEVRINSVDTTYQELDLSKINNKEDNYQSLRPKDDTVDKTYQELDISKRKIEDNNYESLQKNNESEYEIPDERRNYENSNLF